MPNPARIASTRIAWIACFAAACSHQPSPPSAGASADPVPLSASGSPAPAPTPGAPPAGDELCDVAECGPAIRMPNRRCPDGSIGGPTDRCLRKPNGKCGWEIRTCPPGGSGQ